MRTDIPERQLLMFETLFPDVLNPDHELLRAAGLNMIDKKLLLRELRIRKGVLCVKGNLSRHKMLFTG